MDKKIAGLLGAAAGIAAISSAQAAPAAAVPSPALQASSYADLLAPIPNPVTALQADNTARAENLQLAQYYSSYPYYNYGYPPPYYHHHHHHHHNSYYRGYNNHHHHHHHSSAFVGIPGIGGVVVPTR